MNGNGPDETIKCLLCKGVVLFTVEDQDRYKDHLSMEHRVSYYVSWIIEKTIAVAESETETSSSLSMSHPSLSITPLSSKGQEEEETPSMSIFPVETELTEFDSDMIEQLDEEIDPTYDMSGFIEQQIHHSYDFTEARILKKVNVDGKKEYKCSLCPHLKAWPSLHKADRHQVTHIPLAFRKMVQCDTCKERFVTEKNLKKHIDNNLCKGIKFYKCGKCELHFDSRFDLNEHEEVHGELARNIQCHLCGAKFKAQKYLRKHLLSHTNIKPFTCDVCGKGFKSEYYVKHHRMNHFNGLSSKNRIQNIHTVSFDSNSNDQTSNHSFDTSQDIIDVEDDIECITDLAAIDSCDSETKDEIKTEYSEEPTRSITSDPISHPCLDLEVVHVDC
eukprot:GFUD01010059.1.p1 GENE.GFUD01010059.1~~GFUD01010059.1.p1  ORF type:complete len:403 (+),score=91.90 GFUD01010059.1:48-1211(+)